ncbi:MAG: sulfotransferase [bacterium]|nr:sulfotransferase [bacterium]
MTPGWVGARKGLLKRTWGRRLLAPLARDLQPQRWIFLVGCYNSGTTLLRDLLGRHPQIAALPSEGVRLTDSLPRPEDFGWHRMWCRCLADIRLPADESQSQRAQRIRRHWSLAVPAAAANVLEKSIANTARLPFLQAHFAPAYIIHLVRNGYAVSAGLRRKGEPRRFGHHEFGARYPIELCAEQWRVSLEQVATDAAGLEHLLEVSYEDLARDAVGVLARISSFLGLSAMAPADSLGEFDIHGVRSAIRDMNADSVVDLSTQDVADIERVAGPLLQRYGYGRP